MQSSDVFLLPGWQNSGPDHWQSHWEAQYRYQRVEQHDWMRPLRGDWIARLEEVLLAHAAQAADRPRSAATGVVLVAHSLGCHLVAAWAAHSRHTHLVRAALLVAPGDPQREELRGVLASWSPMVLASLPFPSQLLGSHNDPYCSFARAQAFASAWGAQFVDYGAAGHINADSGLGGWPDGHQRMLALRSVSDQRSTSGTV